MYEDENNGQSGTLEKVRLLYTKNSNSLATGHPWSDHADVDFSYFDTDYRQPPTFSNTTFSRLLSFINLRIFFSNLRYSQRVHSWGSHVHCHGNALFASTIR